MWVLRRGLEVRVTIWLLVISFFRVLLPLLTSTEMNLQVNHPPQPKAAFRSWEAGARDGTYCKAGAYNDAPLYHCALGRTAGAECFAFIWV